MSNFSRIEEAQITDRVSMETEVYEDGYFRVSLIDELGLEIASLDGSSREGDGGRAIALTKMYLIDQHLDNN